MNVNRKIDRSRLALPPLAAGLCNQSLTAMRLEVKRTRGDDSTSVLINSSEALPLNAACPAFSSSITFLEVQSTRDDAVGISPYHS